MTDTEVGELWARRHEQMQTFTISSLIRKLVEEREAAYNLACSYHASDSNCHHRENVLRDFGIDPKTWEVKDG